MAIKFVLFDLGNVVILADHRITHLIMEIHGVDPERAKLFYKNEEYADFARGKISENEFYQAILSYLATDLPKWLVRAAHDAHMYTIDQEVVAIMRQISLPFVFATDTNEWQTARQEQLINLRQFPQVLTFRSNEIGFLKRDPGAYERIIQDLSVEPGDAILIDDSPDKIDRAQQIGLQTIHFQNAEQLRRELQQRGII